MDRERGEHKEGNLLRPLCFAVKKVGPKFTIARGKALFGDLRGIRLPSSIPHAGRRRVVEETRA